MEVTKIKLENRVWCILQFMIKTVASISGRLLCPFTFYG